MSDPYDRDSWERRWAAALSDGGHGVGRHPPNAHLTEAAAGLPAGRALDAGAGHGAETAWLADRGWRVTAVDFSTVALGEARARAERLGEDVADRIAWVEGDLSVWAPPPGAYDLVACIHVHVAGSMAAFVQRLADGVAPGGTLVLVGRHPAGGQTQVSVEAAVAALDGSDWALELAEDRPAGNGVDAVVRARRL